VSIKSVKKKQVECLLRGYKDLGLLNQVQRRLCGLALCTESPEHATSVRVIACEGDCDSDVAVSTLQCKGDCESDVAL
jgi:hypothetical protein